MTNATAAPEVLVGLVQWVTFHNPENGFCVLRVKARGHRVLVTVVGQSDPSRRGSDSVDTSNVRASASERLAQKRAPTPFLSQYQCVG